jgi:serine phosphatase RsbU (regulator of sigma subunit)
LRGLPSTFDQPCPFCESFVPLTTGKPHHWGFTSPDGSTIIDAYDFPFTDTDGSPMILEMDIDITERMHAEGALRTAERLAGELLDRMQRPLLDMPKSVEGVEFAAEYRSATTGAPVGGDFYDLYLVPDGRLALIIGDVSGHGFDASRYASLVKGSISLLLLRGERPKGVLAETNDFLIERGSPGVVTVFVALLDLNTGELTYASAGHPGPIAVSGTASCP